MQYPIIPRTWNEFSEAPSVRSHVERSWERWIFREELPTIGNSELRALLFIKSRTLDWQKFAEVIPMSHFLHGLRDGDELMVGDDGRAISSGCGISKEDTVRDALKRLRARDLITCFPGMRGTRFPANVFMPVGETHLADMLLKAGSGILPQHLRGWRIGEHVKDREGGMWKVTGPDGHKIVVEQVVQGAYQTGKSKAFIPPDLSRPTLAEWASFSVKNSSDRSRPQLVA